MPAVAKLDRSGCRRASRSKTNISGADLAVENSFGQGFVFACRLIGGRADFSLDSVRRRRQKHRAMLGVLRYRLGLDSMKFRLDLAGGRVETVCGQLAGQIRDGDSR